MPDLNTKIEIIQNLLTLVQYKLEEVRKDLSKPRILKRQLKKDYKVIMEAEEKFAEVVRNLVEAYQMRKVIEDEEEE